ncbi:uncharacterized protein LOC142607595 [Castanea sativa]|uniref:uncharacterized protein LOC142607595 n=1 Tax=Castanea sativa TaxID=21020 RepID=UPI003F64DC23
MSIARPYTEDSVLESKRGRVEVRPALSFSDEDKVGTYQSHDDTLVVTLPMGGYDVRRVLVDQGCGAEIMYPNLYNGLNLKLENLVSYDSFLVGFNGKTVILKGLIKLPVQTRSKVVEVNFIVVDAYSPYIAILARTMTPCHEDRLFEFTFEGEVPLKGSGRGIDWKSDHGRTVPGRCY